MRSNSCVPNVVRTLLSGFLKKKQLLKKMIACGCWPSYVTYNIFAGGICGNKEFLTSELLELAKHAYEKMLNAGFIIKEMMREGFALDSSTYTKIIDVLYQTSKLEEAFLLFQEMKKNGVVPDVYAYTILIDTFCKVGLIKQASIWFNEMQIDDCTPNVVTYIALIHAYLKTKQVSKDNEFFNSMISMDYIPIITYTTLIDGSCHIYAKMRGNCEEKITDNYFNDGINEILEPNVFIYGALVDGLCKAHKVAEARDLLNAKSSAG
ncbi:hypothetical protein ZIOFF_039174 [Zingiber officinale]|uniref:Pentatricopeptide repeat-containing protein n=1 Tax=Zingiber officinale TaxID=94328 RepID=A0A8J5GAX0_ZINOF|nr:hypothetical protein ZIOFF_039174 [Zingiber officinale]